MKYRPQNAKKAESVEDAARQCSDPVMQPKYDGWRFIVEHTKDGDIKVWSRTGKPYAKQTPEPIVEEFKRLPRGTILDGEMVDLNTQNCIAVTNVFGKSKTPPFQSELDKISFVAFDVMEVEDEDIRWMPMFQRRAALSLLINSLEPDRVALTVQAPPSQEVYETLIEHGFEGVMIKDMDTRYASGKRGHGWWKIKAETEIDVVIMGMELDGKGQHEGKVGRFVVGQYMDGKLVERARVNPYDDAMRNAMSESTLAAVSGLAANDFVGKVMSLKHYGVLKDGLRHPTFARWREDKLPEECFYDNG